MGQYHSPFADLPTGLRRQQLLRWDRPPVSESPAAAWVHIGLASVAHRMKQEAEVARRLEHARPEVRASAVQVLGRLPAEIAAPFAGTVVERRVALGQSVAAGEALLEIADLSRMWLRVDLLEQEVGDLLLEAQLPLQPVVLQG